MALTPKAPLIDRLDYIFNPLKFKARGSVTWDHGPFSARVQAIHVGGYFNNLTVGGQSKRIDGTDGQIAEWLPWVGRHDIAPPTDIAGWKDTLRRRFQRQQRELHVPGGNAVYPSSVVMNVVPAQIAGVASIAVVSPPQRDNDGWPHPTVLAACALLGVTEGYSVGGAQAIAQVFGQGERVIVVAQVGGVLDHLAAHMRRQRVAVTQVKVGAQVQVVAVLAVRVTKQVGDGIGIFQGDSEARNRENKSRLTG